MLLALTWHVFCGINSAGHSVGRLMAGQHPAGNRKSPLVGRCLGLGFALRKGGLALEAVELSKNRRARLRLSRVG